MLDDDEADEQGKPSEKQTKGQRGRPVFAPLDQPSQNSCEAQTEQQGAGDIDRTRLGCP